MKTTVLILTLLCTNICTKATVLTVSNNPDMPAEYSTIGDAYNAAAPNDTLYIYPTFSTYGQLDSYKPLAIIGAGQNMGGGPTSHFQRINLFAEASGTILHGLYLGQVDCYNLTSITIDRNTIQTLVSYVENAIICQNVITVLLGSFENSLVANNLFQGVVANSSENEGLIFANNYVAIDLLINADVVRNNIFFYAYNLTSSNTIFENNMMPTTGNLAESGCTLTNNVITDDPQFMVSEQYLFVVTYPGYPSGYLTGPFANLMLTDTSPGKNAGTDGTDIGLYGGLMPFVEGDVSVSEINRYFPASRIPKVTNITFIDNVVPQSITLKATIKASKQN